MFYAFDLLGLDGQDLRARPLIERKQMLRQIVPQKSSARFYRLTCEQDLEGIVAKRKHGAYGEGWFKIRNPRYSQYEGRRELFEKKRAAGA